MDNEVKFEISDFAVYHTYSFFIESSDGKEYTIDCIENETDDEWIIKDEDGEWLNDGVNDEDTELCKQLIEICQDKINERLSTLSRSISS
jgi:hypothetical protein